MERSAKSRIRNANCARFSFFGAVQQHQLALDHALDVDLVFHQLCGGQHLAGELHLADAERPAAAQDPVAMATAMLVRSV